MASNQAIGTDTSASVPDTQLAATTDESWDEHRLEKAMDVLQDLYVQVRLCTFGCLQYWCPAATRTANHCPATDRAVDYSPTYSYAFKLNVKCGKHSNIHTAQDTFREFTASTKQAKYEIQQFRKAMEAPETKEVLDYGRRSRAERPKAIRPWLIAEHPDWLEKKS